MFCTKVTALFCFSGMNFWWRSCNDGFICRDNQNTASLELTEIISYKFITWFFVFLKISGNKKFIHIPQIFVIQNFKSLNNNTLYSKYDIKSDIVFWHLVEWIAVNYNHLLCFDHSRKAVYIWMLNIQFSSKVWVEYTNIFLMEAGTRSSLFRKLAAQSIVKITFQSETTTVTSLSYNPGEKRWDHSNVSRADWLQGLYMRRQLNQSRLWAHSFSDNFNVVLNCLKAL